VEVSQVEPVFDDAGRSRDLEGIALESAFSEVLEEKCTEISSRNGSSLVIDHRKRKPAHQAVLTCAPSERKIGP